ncbi:hypothetical protein B0H13DRAFT_1866093 [Mycena leptocephala]|nr:hypothetical protein B0H13DRAFT_1866093 [Mycena leptocephala]
MTEKIETHQWVMNGSRVERVACRYSGCQWIFGPELDIFFVAQFETKDNGNRNSTQKKVRDDPGTASKAKRLIKYRQWQSLEPPALPVANQRNEVVFCFNEDLHGPTSENFLSVNAANQEEEESNRMSHRYMQSAVPAGIEMWTYLGWKKKDGGQNLWRTLALNFAIREMEWKRG